MTAQFTTIATQQRMTDLLDERDAMKSILQTAREEIGRLKLDVECVIPAYKEMLAKTEAERDALKAKLDKAMRVVGAANSLLCEDGVAENLVQFNCLFILSDAIAELEK